MPLLRHSNDGHGEPPPPLLLYEASRRAPRARLVVTFAILLDSRARRALHRRVKHCGHLGLHARACRKVKGVIVNASNGAVVRLLLSCCCLLLCLFLVHLRPAHLHVPGGERCTMGSAIIFG
jgi:hypothetical protein